MEKTTFEKYQEFIQQVDFESDVLQKIYSAHLECKKGCSMCCKVERTVFAIEADSIATQIKTLPKEQQNTLKEHQAQTGVCPFLIEDSCSIYPFRPLICRTHGLPLLYLDDDMENWNLTFCEKNFTMTSEDFSFDDEYLNMEHLNQQLANIQKQHHKKSETSDRVSLSSLLAKIKQLLSV